jgi:signal transduction histidine kinase
VLLAMLLATAALVLRYRHSDAPDRVRIRTFVAAALLLVGSETVLPAVVTTLTGGYPDWLDSLDETIFGAALVLAIGVAVLRHHLHGIDVVVNRAAVYLVMTVVVTTVYVVVVGYSSLALGARGTGPELVATALAALCFEPVRRRVQTGMNRLFYGQRDDPERLIARLDRRLDGAESVESLLAAVAETARNGLRLPFVAATVVGEDGSEIVVARGSATGPVVTFPVVVGSRGVGSIAAQARASERGLAERDRRALLDYSAHAAPALWAARMTGELLGARARLVAARENERSRLRRDLHDGLGADLGSQAILLDAIRRLVREDPARAERLLLDARERMQAAVTDLRRTLDDLRPAVLDDHGLAAALRALVERHAEAAMTIELRVDLAIEPPAAVQTAAYRIVSEAVSNSLRHSGGGLCRIEVRGTAESLQLRVQDDGQGMRSSGTSGVGLRSIRERAAELGGSATTGGGDAGGAVVTAVLPFEEV